MSYIELRDDVDLYEYHILLAEALDAEELESYNAAVSAYIGVNNPKKLKKWKWASSDRAGTNTQEKDPVKSLAAFAASITGSTKPTGNAVEFAKATGRPIAYLHADGTLTDNNGNIVEKTPETVILPVSQMQNEQLN